MGEEIKLKKVEKRYSQLGEEIEGLRRAIDDDEEEKRREMKEEARRELLEEIKRRHAERTSDLKNKAKKQKKN